MPLTITVFSVSQFVPRMVIRFGVRNLMMAGCILVAASVIGFSRLNSNSTYWGDIIFPLILHSVGAAFVFTPGSIIVLEGVDDQDAGIASGVLQVSQQIGGAVGIAAIVSIYTASLKPHDFSSGLSNAFLAAAGISVLAAIIIKICVPHRTKTSK
jgi:MFS family permease